MSDTTTTQKRPKGVIPRQITDNLIAVASGKGGVGKTWFSTTLCQALAKQGKKVLLFDGDLGLANVDVQLGLMVKRDLNDVIEGNLPMERVIHHYEDGGFDIIAGRSGQASLSSIPLQKLNEMLKQLRALAPKYDVVLMDLGAGVERTVRFLAAAAAMTCVVTNDEPTSLTDAYAFIKLSNSTGHADTLRIVVNIAANEKDAERTYSALTKVCDKFLNIDPPLMGIVRYDKRVREAIKAQVPFLTRSPSSEAAEDIEKIANKILEAIPERAETAAG